MKHYPKYPVVRALNSALLGAAGIVCLGWIVPVIGQQPGAFNPNPGATAPAFSGGLNSAQPAPIPARANGTVHVPHGLVTAIDDIKVPARDAGSLTKINVKPGALVDVDFVLGEIDNRDTLAKQRIAQGELDAATVQANSQAEIIAAKKGYDVAKAEYDSAKEIKAKNPGAISDQELRRAGFQQDRAQAQIQVAEVENLVHRQTVLIKQAQLDATQVELRKKKIEAPIQGQIVEVYKHMGEWVQPGDPVLRLVRLDRVRVEGFVYAAEAGRTELEGKPVSVKVYLPGGKEVVVNGRVDYASPVIEGSGRNRQYRIWTEVDNQFVDGNFVIQPGASAEMTVNVNAAKIPAPVAAPAPAPAVAPGFAPRTEGPAVEAPPVETLKPELPAETVAPAPAPAPMPIAPATSRPATSTPAPATKRPAATAAPATKSATPATKSAIPATKTPAPRTTAPR
jgi:macrolide-specific efflux system membrane fusion protein